MPHRHSKFLNLDGYIKYPQRLHRPRFRKGIQQGESLYQQFNQFEASHIVRIKYPRLIPPVVVELGELVGLIYRSDKWQPGQPRSYIHLMQDPPHLVSNVEGTQLYILGGSYRITEHGIEG